MLKITATGNLTNDVELKMNETTGKPYAILRIASDRRYAPWPSSVLPMPGRAASWPPPATSRPSLFLTIPPAGPAF